jgi:hypothetical protein
VRRTTNSSFLPINSEELGQSLGSAIAADAGQGGGPFGEEFLTTANFVAVIDADEGHTLDEPCINPKTLIILSKCIFQLRDAYTSP